MKKLKYIKLFEYFLNEKSMISDKNFIKEEIEKYYNKQIETKIGKNDINIEIIDGVNVVWIPKHVFQEMGKRGFSESDAKNNRIIMSKHLKDKDQDRGQILHHEIGHLIDNNKKKDDSWKGNDPIFKGILLDKNGKESYPNWKNEYFPFYNQYKALKKVSKTKEDIIEGFLYDYKKSGKVSKEELKKYKDFFIKLIDLFKDK